MKYSIIIPVRTINAYLRENIEHLKKLNHDSFEVIILVDDSTNEEIPNFTFISTGPVGPGEKRNIGAIHAQGEILAFLDDDAFPTSEWLNEADKIFNNYEPKDFIYALGAPASTPPDASFLEKCSGLVLESFLASGNTVYRHVPQKRLFVDDYPTVNLFVKKEAFLKVGGFNVEFWPGEDTKLCLDLIKEFKSKFLYDPSPLVYHHRRELFLPHLKQISRYGMHRGQFARIFPENSFVITYFVPAAFSLGLIIGPILSLFVPILWWFYGLCISLYVLLLAIECIRAYLKSRNLLLSLMVIPGIFTTHLVYGFSFVYGLITRPKLKLRNINSSTGNYIGG